MDISAYDEIWNNNTCVIGNSLAYNFHFQGGTVSPRLVLIYIYKIVSKYRL